MTSPQRAVERLAIIHSQLTDTDKTVSLTESGVPIVNGELQYSVPVPEHLTPTGDWQVRRYLGVGALKFDSANQAR